MSLLPPLKRLDRQKLRSSKHIFWISHRSPAILWQLGVNAGYIVYGYHCCAHRVCGTEVGQLCVDSVTQEVAKT